MVFFLSLGSNIGDRQHNLQSAIYMMQNELDIKINSTSFIYETEPVGDIKQNWFYNIACSINSNISPLNLLLLCKSIEYALGRRKSIIWGERIIDIDILLCDNIILQTNTLTIPHKHLHKRRFVLAPLTDIAPNYIHPVLQTTIYNLLQNCKDTSEIRITNNKI